MFLCHISHAQYLFQEAYSGFGISTQFTSSDGVTLFSVSPSYTSNGQTTIGVSVGIVNISGSNVSGTLIQPFISHLLIRQDDEMPVHVTSYGYYQYKTYNVDLKANTFSFGLSASREIEANSMTIFPYAGAGWITSSLSSGFNSIRENAIQYSIGTYTLLNNFHISPNWVFSNGNSTFNLQLGLIFPQ